MALTKYKLGELITLCTGGNEDLKYGKDSVKGISINKNFMETKADLSGVSLANYTVVSPKCFSFVTVTSRNGNKISIAYNDSNDSFLVSSFYVTFRLSEFGKTVLLEDYLYMFFNRSEFDRYARRDSWGSAREYFYFENICDVEITLPGVDVQKKYVDIYKAMVSNQQSYERGLEDLKLVCDGYIEDLRRKMPCESIGQYIQQRNERNSDKSIDCVMGLSTKKEFREAQSRVNRDELGNYKIVNPYDIAFVPTTDTWKVLAFAVNRFDKPLVVSPIYEVFSVNQTKLLSQYLAIWLSRKEFDRYARFNSWGSARENFSFEDMQSVQIPVPKIEVQKAIVDMYNAYIMRKENNEQLKAQIKDICPILIRGSLEEGTQ